LAALIVRQKDLLAALQGRAHAATVQVVIDTGEETMLAVRHVMKSLAIIRCHPEWSTLSADVSEDAHRAQVIDLLVRQLD
jgi:hypothetical protein